MAYELDRTTRAAVQFKLGTQEAMNTMLSKNTEANSANRAGTHGTFYLTQDTHRLYVGNADNTISPVNEGILTVTSLPTSSSTPAPMPGQFYYLSGQNILAIYAGNNQWIQVNAATSEVDSVTNTISTTSGTTTIQTTVSSTDGSSKSDSFTVTGTSGITASSNGKAITLTGNVGSLSAADYLSGSDDGVTVTLDNSNGTDSTLNIKAGSNVEVAMNNGAVRISAEDSTITSVTGSNVAAGGFKFNVTDSSGANAEGTIDPIIKYGSGTTTSVHFLNGTATLDVYTKSQTDTAIATAVREVNAMTYKGTVDSASDLPGTSDNVRIGDTYITNADITTGGVTYPAGSMVIAAATNTESSSTGYITDNPIKWDYVDSAGSDTTYSAVNATYGFGIKPSTQSDPILQYQLAAGTAMTLSESGTLSASGGKTVTVTHANVSSSKTTGSAWEQGYNTSSEIAEVVTGVTVNAQGHVTGYTVRKLTFHNEVGTLSAIGYSETAVNTANHTYTNVSTATSSGTTTATVSLGYKLTDGNGAHSTASNSFGIASENLEVTSSGMNVGINLVWGSFTA